LQPEADVPTNRSTIKKENIKAHAQKQGGGLGLLAQVAAQGLPGRAKHRAPEQVVEGQGTAAPVIERTDEDIEKQRLALAEASGGKQKTLLAMLPAGANVADLRAGLKKQGGTNSASQKPQESEEKPEEKPVQIIPPPKKAKARTAALKFSVKLPDL